MFNMPTSGPLSPIVSLERRKLEQQGIPPGQEQQGSAAKGSPISGDLAQLIQLNRMLQQQGTMQQQANPAPSTVAQDLMQQVTQQRAPQMQPQMPPQMQQMPPQMDPRQQGIAQLPQEAVGNGMAAGGIVAFDDGGSVRHFADGGLTDQEKAELAKLEALHNAVLPAYGAGYDAEMAKQQTRARYQELHARQKAAEQTTKDQAQADKVSGVLSQYGLGAPVPAPAAATPAAPVPPEVKQAIAATRAARPSRDEGLAEFVPTLSIPKRSALDVYARNAGIEADRTSAYYDKKRKEEEDAAGLTGIWKRQQEEQERLKAEASPEEQKRAFWNNLAARLADQSGQRGVSRSSRIAQMVGAIGGAKSSTEEAFKKRREDLNRAANDLQEKQAMYRMTGMKADRADLEKAKARYEDILKDKETLEQRTQEAKDTSEYRRQQIQQTGDIARAQLGLGYAQLNSREGIAELESMLRGAGKTMSQKDIGDSLQALEASDAMSQWVAAQIAAKGKKVVGTPEFTAAKNQRLMELFNAYYGGSQGSVASAIPANVQSVLNKYK